MMLRCNSVDGTQPLKYTWERITGNKLLPPAAVLGKSLHSPKILVLIKMPQFKCRIHLSLDPVGGTMNLRNATETASGTYRCVAKNNVGTEECVVEVNVTSGESAFVVHAHPPPSATLILMY